MKDVKVYAQNLRSYNIGLDQGRWITLGIEEQELQRILTEQLHLTKNHPDMAIFDYQADFEISEYEDIYELNQAVAQLKQLSEQDYEKVMDYCDARDITSPLEISNVCLQADEVPYERFPDWIDENVNDPKKNLDMHCLKITVWLQKLKLLVWKVILITKRMEEMKPLIHMILVTMAL